MSRVLVTGGLGFIGSALCRALVDAGHEVRSLDDGSRGKERRKVKGVEYTTGNVAQSVGFYVGSIDPWPKANPAERTDAVFHLAAINGTRNFYERPEDVLEVQLRGTLNALEECKLGGVKTLVLFSSSEVYGQATQFPTPETEPLKIADPLNPRWSYAASKIAAEMLCLHAPHLERVIVIRPHNIYGPDMGEDHVIPELTLAMLRGDKPLDVQGDGSQSRAFCYVTDLVSATMAAWEQCGPGRHIFHVGTERETAIGDLVGHIQMALGCPAPTIRYSRSELPGSPRRRVPDTRRIRALGWVPKVTLEEGLRETVGWYRRNAK